MAMVENNAIAVAIAELQSKGFNTNHPLFKGNIMVEAIVNAVIAEVRNADVIVSGGSSSGTYKPV